MKLLFLTDNFPPEVNAPASRTFEHCREWVRSGVDVTVLTCAPNFPKGRVYPGYQNRWLQEERVAGIRVIRVWSYMAPNKGFVRRTLDYLSYACHALGRGLFVDMDMIVATSPQFFTAVSGGCLSALKRKPWVFEVRDLWPASISALGALKQGWLLDRFEKLELSLYRRADAVVVLTPAFKDDLMARGIPGGKLTVVPNGIDGSLFSERSKPADLVEALGLAGKFVVGYLGTHGMAHDLENIVSFLWRVEDPDIHFLFIGDGARKEAVVAGARSKGIKQVTFLDPVERSQAPRYLSLFDAALVPLKNAPLFKTVIPSKIFEAAAMGKPMLLGVDGQARRIVDQYGAGLFFEPGNGEAFLAALSRLKNDTGLYASMTRGCARLSADYDRRKLAGDMLDVLHHVFKKSRGGRGRGWGHGNGNGSGKRKGRP